jgi:predicted SprT family Zn-dependent metalloprotease
MIIEESYRRLYSREIPFEASLKFSRRFKGYNANIRKLGNAIQVSLSRKWKEVDREIAIGLIQVLLLKILKDKRETTNTRLYNSFIKSLHISTPKTVEDDILKQSFERVNDRYFSSLIEMPCLSWGSMTFRKLASYEYQSDELIISSIFKNAEPEIIDFLMYHELLHKKLKYYDKNGRSYHHTAEFRRLEQKYDRFEEIEKTINALVRAKLRKSYHWFF